VRLPDRVARRPRLDPLRAALAGQRGKGITVQQLDAAQAMAPCCPSRASTTRR
jgi:hypothetical protein